MRIFEKRLLMRIFENVLLKRIFENSLLLRIFENSLLVRTFENRLLVRTFENSLLMRIFENVMQRSGPCASLDSPVLIASPQHVSVTIFIHGGHCCLLLRQTQNLDVASRAVLVRQTAVLYGSVPSVRRCVYGRQMRGSRRQ
jgi:hypothetical protein